MPVITGTEGPDQLSSTDQQDELYALGGDDVVTIRHDEENEGHGPELFDGGAGDDLLIVRLTAGNYWAYRFDATTGTVEAADDGLFNSVRWTANFTGFERYDVQIVGRWIVNIRTGGGDDVIYALDPVVNYTLAGGAGDDVYHIGQTRTVPFERPGEGTDTVYFAGPGGFVDQYSLPDNIERLFVEPGFESRTYRLNGNALDNEIGGGEMNDTIDLSSGGIDKAYGHGGDDRFFFYNHSFGPGDFIDGGAGRDTIWILGGLDVVLTGTALVDVEVMLLFQDGDYRMVATDALLTAGARLEIDARQLSAADMLDFDGSAEIDGRFAIFSGAGNDVLRGSAGDDYIDGAAGVDLMVGGEGDDRYIIDNAGDVVIEAEGEGNDTISTSVSYSLGSQQSIETLSTRNHSGTEAINLIGNEIANRLIGNNGNNVLNGNDGADVMIGLGGDDTYVVDHAGDVVIEGAGGGNDTILTDISYQLANTQEVETLSTRTHAGTAAINLIGNNLANKLVGNNGNNHLNGNAGADVMIGLGGDDTYVVDNVGDVVIEQIGGGNDTILTDVSFVLANDQEVETISTRTHAGTAAINLTGNNLANKLIGNHGDNYLNGNGGADVMIGLNGNDTYVVDHAGDVVVEALGGGNDTVRTFVSYTLGAGVEVETMSTAVHASTEALNLTGNEFAQKLIGNNGANWLDGKGGGDVLIGLGGADTFAFTTALGASNIDTIQDFQVGVDKIALDDAVFTALSAGALAAGAFHIGAAATSAAHRIVYDSATGALFYDADGNGAGAAVQFATLQAGLTTLSAGDFTVI